MNGDQTTKGWGASWIEALERLATSWHNRLQRGETYAQRGHVLSLQVQPGKLSARVQGSRSKPYTTTIEVPTFREHHWHDVIKELANEARTPALLLAGRMPPNIFPYFERRNLHLFPFRNSELYGNCNCPEKQRPCKHIIAVHYAFGEALNRDPFLLFQLRGADRGALLRGLRRAWFGNDVERERDEPVDEVYEVGERVMPLSADRFNRSPATLDEIPIYMRAPDQEYLILRRLGAPPSWSLPLPIEPLLGPVYDEAAALALEIAHAEAKADEFARPDDDFGDELQDYSDNDDDDDGEWDEDGDGDGADAEAAAAEVERRPIPTLRPIPSTGSPASAPTPTPASPASPPASAQTGAAPAPASFLLPKSLGRESARARVETPVPEEAVAQQERSSVLIRKGQAASGPLRRRGGRTEETPAPPPAEVPAIEPVPMESTRSSVTASDPSRARETSRRGKARAQAAPAPVVVRRSAASEAVVQPASEPPTPVAPVPPAPPADVPKRRPGRVAASQDGESPRAARATRAAKPAEAPPTPARDLSAFDDAAARALDKGRHAQALEAVREAWRAERTEPRLLMLAAVADAMGRRVELLSEEVERIESTRRRTRDTPSLVDVEAMILASRYTDAVERALQHPTPPVEMIEVVTAFAVEAARTAAPKRGSAMAGVLDELFARGEDWFESMSNPPAPLGAWVEWTLKDAPPTPRMRRQLAIAASELVRRGVSAEQRAEDVRVARCVAAVVAVLEQLGEASAMQGLLADVATRATPAMRAALDGAFAS